MTHPIVERFSIAASARTEPFRVGVFVDSQAPPAWSVSCIRQLRALPGVSVELLEVSPRPANKTNRVFAALRHFSSSAYNPEKPEPLDKAADLRVAVHQNGELTAGSREAVQQRGYDLLIDFAIRLRNSCAGLARLGAWSVAVGDCVVVPGTEAFFWNARAPTNVIELSILHHAESFDRGAPFCRFRIPKEPGLRYTISMRGLEALPLLTAIYVLRVRENGDALRLDEPLALRSEVKPPRLWSTSAFVVRKAMRSLRLSGSQKARKWFMAYRLVSDDNFREAVTFSGHEAADPFAYRWDDRHYIFFEDVPPSKGLGRLAVSEVFDDGRLSTPVVILERSYHLSYPCVFHHDGQHFMIPESSANRTVDLYKAVSFPHHWALHRTLVEGIRLVDTTPFLHDNVWYFFTTALLPQGGLMSLLFMADSLDAEWRPHPVNPISTDAAASRGAGAIYWDGDRLIRPVQNCAVAYGYAVVLNEIEELSPTVFRERRVGEILPRWRPDLVATHTTNRAGALEVRDGRRLI